QGRHGPAAAREHPGDDRVVRPHPRVDRVRVALRGGEAVAAVVEGYAVARHDHAGAEAPVVRLDERHHHAAGVGGAEVDGPAGARLAVGRVAGARTYEPRALGQVALVEQVARV